MKFPEHYKKWDLFISHASEDKEEVARPLAHMLNEMGFKVWFDEFTLKIGESLSEAIADGLRTSKYGIVILSPAFMKKRWPKNELGALLAAENEATRVLPIWHRVTKMDVIEFNAVLADRIALNSSEPLEILSGRIAEKLRGIPQRRVPEDVIGTWKGISGNIVIQEYDGLLVGDYDWFGNSWVGRLIGQYNEDVFRYQWDWTINDQKGSGFFLRQEIRMRMQQYPICHLIGGWVYEAQQSRIEPAINLYRSLIQSNIAGFYLREEVQGVVDEGLYPWIFAFHR